MLNSLMKICLRCNEVTLPHNIGSDDNPSAPLSNNLKDPLLKQMSSINARKSETPEHHAMQTSKVSDSNHLDEASNATLFTEH